MVGIKICGIRDEAALQAALAAGADFIGLVFYPPSPRNVSLKQAARLADVARGRARIVALTVRADDAMLEAIGDAVRPDYVQAHGDEPVERIAEMRRLTGCPVIRAFRLKGADDLEQVPTFAPHIAFPLFDAWHDKADLPGGMGKAFDWSWLAAWEGPFMLAGGLTPENVARAIAETGAPMVDVSSGVEAERGRKDPALIAEFVRRAKGVA